MTTAVILNVFESELAEKLVDVLYKRATDKLNFITTCFDYIAPECTYDTPGCFDAPNIIAFGAGTRIKNGISNQKNISVAEIREELIATAIEQFSSDEIDNYTEYKNSFIRHISNLKKCIGDGAFNEAVYISKFLSKLDQDLYDKIYLLYYCQYTVLFCRNMFCLYHQI
jgi:hypothetical protein